MRNSRDASVEEKKKTQIVASILMSDYSCTWFWYEDAVKAMSQININSHGVAVALQFYSFFLVSICCRSAFSRTGFDCHTSLVFSPANPESSIEECLAVLGSRVGQDLGSHLNAALLGLLGK